MRTSHAPLPANKPKAANTHKFNTRTTQREGGGGIAGEGVLYSIVNMYIYFGANASFDDDAAKQLPKRVLSRPAGAANSTKSFATNQAKRQQAKQTLTDFHNLPFFLCSARERERGGEGERKRQRDRVEEWERQRAFPSACVFALLRCCNCDQNVAKHIPLPLSHSLPLSPSRSLSQLASAGNCEPCGHAVHQRHVRPSQASEQQTLLPHGGAWGKGGERRVLPSRGKQSQSASLALCARFAKAQRDDSRRRRKHPTAAIASKNCEWQKKKKRSRHALSTTKTYAANGRNSC